VKGAGSFEIAGRANLGCAAKDSAGEFHEFVYAGAEEHVEIADSGEVTIPQLHHQAFEPSQTNSDLPAHLRQSSASGLRRAA
jgi:hypothetical protein